MKLHLVDTQAALIDAWREEFTDFPEIRIDRGNILTAAENTLVSPANSFGFMDGGLDAEIVEHFGLEIQTAVRDAVARRPEGHLPVGASTVVKTGDDRVPYLLVAPTMTQPGAVDAQNAYRAFRAVLRAADALPDVARKIFCPGLTTGVGGVPSRLAAKEMASAYRDWRTQRED